LGEVILAAIASGCTKLTAPDLIPIWRVLGWFTPALIRRHLGGTAGSHAGETPAFQPAPLPLPDLRRRGDH